MRDLLAWSVAFSRSHNLADLEAEPMAALTLLDEIRIATPCQENWEEMAGDDRVRSCATCSRSVYNVAALTSDEVSSLIATREGRLCLRLYRRADGTLVTADCPPLATTSRPRPGLRRVYAPAIVLFALLLVWMGTKPGESPPSGAGVTWEDWVQWASVSVGLRPKPPTAPNYAPMPSMGDMF